MLAPIYGRFGHLLKEIAMRSGANAVSIETQWGQVFGFDELEAAIKKYKPAVLAISQGDTSVTVKQPLKSLAALCKAHNCILYVDATATLGGCDAMLQQEHEIQRQHEQHQQSSSSSSSNRLRHF